MEFGVVVPAYRGERVLHRSLLSLARQEFGAPEASEVHVVVAVNDGRADTEREANRLSEELRSAGLRCTVVTSPPGRASAFDRAEQELAPGPRLYLDQDAELTPNALRELAVALAPGGAGFATLRPAVRTTTWIAAAYYRAWVSLPYVVRSPASAGCYAVSAAGRARWGAFPKLHSDDKFVRLRFEPAERRLIGGAGYEVEVSGGLRELINARRRYLRGNRELRTTGPFADAPRHGGYLSLVPQPGLWAGMAVFGTVYVAAATAELLRRAGG